jgi:ketosteroid isomerase-like protein
VSAQDLTVARSFFDALMSAARTGDRDGLYPLLATDVEWLTPLRSVRGLGELQNDPSWPWGMPRPAFNVDFEERETVDLGDGRIVADFREIYRTRDSGDVAYARDRQIELTVRGEKIARYELRFTGS